MQVPKATLDFFESFHVLVRVSVMGGPLALSRVGPPPTWRRRVRTFSPTPCVGSPGRDPCQWFRHADLRSGVLDLRVSRMVSASRASRACGDAHLRTA